MLTYQCSKGHTSTESDYCSECGTKIQGTSEPVSTVKTLDEPVFKVKNDTLDCPACTAPHDPSSGNFCEICGYNFSNGTHGEVPPIQDNQVNLPSQSPILPSPPSFLSPPPPALHILEIVITVDPSLRSPESPEPPNQAPIILRLDKEINLIGRRSEVRGINPEIALNFDSAVSHRHAIINYQPDGTFTLRDIDSANGTKLNNVELPAMVDAVLNDGDEFTLGHWTRIKVNFRF